MVAVILPMFLALFSEWGKMVFCFENCSDQLSEKFVLVIEKIYCEFEAEGQEFANILRSLEQFLGKGKSQNNFRNRMFF